jgi:hypothetical protein
VTIQEKPMIVAVDLDNYISTSTVKWYVIVGAIVDVK